MLHNSTPTGGKEMRIAVATDDGKVIRFGHFGDAEMYYIYDFDGKEFKLIEVKENPYTDEKLGITEHNDPRKARIIYDFLKDCDVFVGHSMGMRNRKILEEMGILMVALKRKNVPIENALKIAVEKAKEAGKI